MASFDRTDTSSKVINIVSKKLSIDKNSVTESSTLQGLGADSLDTFKILLDLQDKFGIEIDDDAADNFSDLKNVVEFIHEKRTK